MAKLLHIQSSPRGNRAASIAVAKQFINSYHAAHPGDVVETLDVWEANLPEFNGAMQEAKYAILSGQPHTAEQLNAWRVVTRIAEHFKSADKFIISLPMWNFGIPYKLKHYIDILTQPGLTFSFTPSEGYKGLVTGKPLVAVYARGGAYGPGTGAEAYDQQSSFVKQIFGFIGFTNIQEIFVEPTITSATAKDEAVATANRKAVELAANF
ncbi:MAG: NAD(P)H-dependent oxidoreductase [Limisphaerales bacterium]